MFDLTLDLLLKALDSEETVFTVATALLLHFETHVGDLLSELVNGGLPVQRYQLAQVGELSIHGAELVVEGCLHLVPMSRLLAVLTVVLEETLVRWGALAEDTHF
jgi:hypothetical protein